MSFDRAGLIAACEAHGTVARVVVAANRGSVPREAGASMLVWRDGMSGTIGGGALEYQAALAARDQLETGRFALSHHPLGPALGQCCGGYVELLTEVYDLAAAEALPEDVVIRGQGEMPFAVSRLKADARGQGSRPDAQWIDGWMVESVTAPSRNIWIWGAGHVGQALASTLEPLPDFQITMVDTSEDRFPKTLPTGVDRLVASDPVLLVHHAPEATEHLIVTFSHALDLSLCHALLSHRFAFAGLIGSATKWVRFRKRLAELGHSTARIDQITCPIGRPDLGKHPHQIALGVATALLERQDRALSALKGHG